MDLFLKAKIIRLVTHTDKYLIAEEDRLTISQDRDRSAKNALWTVEIVEGKDLIRLRSCFGTYLTASSAPLLLGVTLKKVIQTRHKHDDPTIEWEPVRDGMQVRLKSLWGNYLRPNSGLSPWRNSVTHDIPHRNKTNEKILWVVEVVEKCVDQRRLQPETTFNKSRSVNSASVDSEKQSDNVRRVLLVNRINRHFFDSMCCWRPKKCVPVSR